MAHIVFLSDVIALELRAQISAQDTRPASIHFTLTLVIKD